MTSYSFSDPSTTLVGSALDTSNTGGNGAVKPTGGSVYDGSRVYRRDSVMAGAHHSGDYQLHQSSHTIDTKSLNGGNAAVGVSSSSSSLTDALAGINTSSVNDNTFADYFFKQQVMSLNSSHSDTSGHASPQQYHRQQVQGNHNQSDISSVVAAVAAATNSNAGAGGHGSSSDYSVYQHGPTTLQAHSQRQHSYSATHHCQQGMLSSHQSPSAAAAALPGTVNMSPATATSFSSSATTPSSAAITHNTSAACLVDPLPSFLSSLPLQNSVNSSKHPSAVAAANNSRMGNGGITNSNNNTNGSVGGGDHNKENHEGGGSSILAAAAAAAAAAVVSTGGDSGSGVGNNIMSSSSASNTDLASLASGTNPYYNSGDLNHASSTNNGVMNSQGSHSHGYYNQSRNSHSYGQPQQPGHSAYNVNGFSFSHNSSPTAAAIGATTTSPIVAVPPSLSTQNTAVRAGVSADVDSTASSSAAAVAAAAVAAVALGGGGGSSSSATNPLDMSSYSISAFSRPLSQSSGTATSMFLNNSSGGGNDPTGATATTASSGLATSFASDVGQPSSVMSPPQQLHSHYQYYQQPQQQQRGYGDYSTYYRSSSNALAMGATTGNTTTTGASPMSGTGIGAASATTVGTHVSGSGAPQLTAAAAAAAAAMGSGYYASAYQPYMRAGVGAGAHSYYYSQAPGRYIPYGAYPPIRHFVSPARPFKCETCEQSFSRNHDLKRHVKIHSGIKPHKCHKCGKSFGRSDALKRHSMVKRCRTTTSTAAVSSSASAKSMPTQTPGANGMNMASQRQNKPQTSVQLPHQPRDLPLQQQQGSSGNSLMSSLAGSSRLAPVGSMFGQPSASTMATSTSSIVSSMLASRTNSI